MEEHRDINIDRDRERDKDRRGMERKKSCSLIFQKIFPLLFRCMFWITHHGAHKKSLLPRQN